MIVLSATFYNNTSDKIVMNKNITLIKTATFTPTSDVNIFNPTITLDYDGSILTSNYMYIPTFRRYYYIDNISLQIGKKMLLTGYVDTLMSFSRDIKEAFVNVCRAENPANRDLADDKIQVNPKAYFIETNVFPENPYTFGGRQYVLGVNGTEVITE